MSRNAFFRPHVLCCAVAMAIAGEICSEHGRGAAGAGRTVSSSVVAGLPIQEKPMTLNAPLSISPSSPGKLEFAGKYAKKFGLCQCVMPAVHALSGR